MAGTGHRYVRDGESFAGVYKRDGVFGPIRARKGAKEVNWEPEKT